MTLIIRTALFCLLYVFLGCATAKGQQQANPLTLLGLRADGVYDGTGPDHVDMQSGNLIARIPLFSIPQRGGLSLSFSMSLNTGGWTLDNYCDAYQCEFGAYRPDAPIGPAIELDDDPFVTNFGLGWGYSIIDPGSVCDPNKADDPACDAHSSGPTDSYSIVGYKVQDQGGSIHPLAFDADNLSQLRSGDSSGFCFAQRIQEPSIAIATFQPRVNSIALQQRLRT